MHCNCNLLSATHCLLQLLLLTDRQPTSRLLLVLHPSRGNPLLSLLHGVCCMDTVGILVAIRALGPAAAAAMAAAAAAAVVRQ
jgi:hypothetical protein